MLEALDAYSTHLRNTHGAAQVADLGSVARVEKFKCNTNAIAGVYPFLARLTRHVKSKPSQEVRRPSGEANEGERGETWGTQ